ncbi:MAG TPA: carboxypeptidase-like regulatory domain-containing protein [Thermoanaerobaculia bacterium]|nr:carboxypeptidase-like regulatory domain-containing protein [Thermoanaerobaculia bacterium]
MRPLLLTVAIVLLTIAASDRQPPAPASFGGYLIADATGLPMAGARVTFTGPATCFAVTDAHGLFAIPRLPPGQYAVAVAGRSIAIAVTDGMNVRDLRL